jgi:hypothetical protein
MQRLWSWLTAAVTDLSAKPPPMGAMSPFDLPSEDPKLEKTSTYTAMPVLRNPGKFDSLDSTVTEMTEVENQTWRGLQVNFQNILHPKFVVAHQLFLGKNENIDMMGNKDEERSRYEFISYAQTKNWTLNGRIGTGGMTQARVSYEKGMFFSSFMGVFSEDEQRNHWQADAGLKFSDSTIEAKLQGPAIGLAYTQAIIKHFTLGTEIFFSPIQDAARLKFVSVAGNKETSGTWTTSYSTGLQGDQVGVNYTRRVIRNLDMNVGTEIGFEPKNKSWSTNLKFGYLFKLDNGGTVRGSLDSNYSVATVVEEPLSDMMMVTFSGKVNVPKNIYDIGVGINLSM